MKDFDLGFVLECHRYGGNCNHSHYEKHGFSDKTGAQKYKCLLCGTSFMAEYRRRPVGKLENAIRLVPYFKQGVKAYIAAKLIGVDAKTAYTAYRIIEHVSRTSKRRISESTNTT